MVLACVVAFHVTLRQLGEALLIDSPLAYLGLVPGGAVVIAAVRARRRAHEPDIEDRQLDLIVGGPLIAVSLVGQLILQDRLGDTFWLLRLDLLLLPLFAAGATAVLLGVRTMWRVRFGLALLFLAWPMPWSRLLSLVQDQVATATTSAVAALAAPLGLAQQAAGSDGSLFTVDHGGEAIRLSVASACAGLNGTVSYLVVGSLLMGLTQGPAGRKLCWLICGTALAWALNLLRILVLFLVAGQWGLAAAMEVLHPVLGLLLSNIGIAVMLWRLRSFGLTFAGRREPVTPAVTRAPGHGDRCRSWGQLCWSWESSSARERTAGWQLLPGSATRLVAPTSRRTRTSRWVCPASRPRRSAPSRGQPSTSGRRPRGIAVCSRSRQAPSAVSCSGTGSPPRS